MDLATLKELRARSGASLTECKAALTNASGDLELAVKLLQRAGTTDQEKKQMVSRLRVKTIKGVRLGFGRTGTLTFGDPWAVDSFHRAVLDIRKKPGVLKYLDFVPLRDFELDDIETGQGIPCFFGSSVDITLESGRSAGELETLRHMERNYAKAINSLPWSELAVHTDVSSFEQDNGFWLLSAPEDQAHVVFGSVTPHGDTSTTGATIRGDAKLPKMVTKRIGSETSDGVGESNRTVHAINVAPLGGDAAVKIEITPAVEAFAKELIEALGPEFLPAYLAFPPAVYQALSDGVELEGSEEPEDEDDDHIGFSDIVTGVLVAGRPISFGTFDEALAVRAAVERLANSLTLPLVVVPDCDLSPKKSKKASDSISGTFIVGMEIERCEADKGAAGRPSWELSAQVSSNQLQRALDDAKRVPAEVFDQLVALCADSELGDLNVYLTSCGPLSAASIKLPDGKTLQVSTEGTSYIPIDFTNGNCTIAAQYD
jgi:hypothetical protein